MVLVYARSTFYVEAASAEFDLLADRKKFRTQNEGGVLYYLRIFCTSCAIKIR